VPVTEPQVYTSGQADDWVWIGVRFDADVNAIAQYGYETFTCTGAPAQPPTIMTMSVTGDPTSNVITFSYDLDEPVRPEEPPLVVDREALLALGRHILED
jgi:hypothetical protein